MVELEKSIHRLGQNNTLPFLTVQKDRAPYRTIKSCIISKTTIQKQQQQSSTSNNHFELEKAIKQHLTIGITRQINPQSRPELTTNVYNSPEASNTLQKNQELYKTFHNHGKAVKTIMNR